MLQETSHVTLRHKPARLRLRLHGNYLRRKRRSGVAFSLLWAMNTERPHVTKENKTWGNACGKLHIPLRKFLVQECIIRGGYNENITSEFFQWPLVALQLKILLRPISHHYKRDVCGTADRTPRTINKVNCDSIMNIFIFRFYICKTFLVPRIVLNIN